MAKYGFGVAVLISATMWTNYAQADEIRLGVMAHDAKIFTGGVAKKEESVSITAEYIFDTPNWLDWAGGARPYVYGAANLGGHTHHGGAGLNWQADFFSKFYADFEAGLTVHSGTNEIPRAVLTGVSAEQRRANAFEYLYRVRNEIQFGSSVLFRGQLAIGYRFNDVWSADLSYEHLSHAGIFNGTYNDGLDSVGLRVSRKF